MRKQKTIVSCIALAAAGLTSSHVFAQASVSNVTTDVYGQVNMAVMASDTGNGSENYIVDNDYSSSRIGARLQGDLDDTDLTVGAHLELEYQISASNTVSETNRSGADAEFGERQVNLFVSGNFGKVSLGQGDGAANGNSERDLSGTALASYTDLSLVGGDLSFVDPATGAGPTLRAAMNSQDFESRYKRIRYDLPALVGGVKVALSHGIKGNSDVNEVGLRYSGDLGGKIEAALGYSTKDVGGAAGNVDIVGGSVSWLHESGINVMGSYTTSSDDNAGNPDTDFYLGRLGYKMGQHAFDIHYAVSEDRVLEGDEADAIGVGYVFTPVKYFNVYAGLNRHSLDRAGADFEDIDTLLAGARLSF